MTRENANNLIESVVRLRDAASDKDASRCVACYPALSRRGALVTAGTRIRWGDKLMRAAVDLWDRPENAPDQAPNLWEKVLYKDGYRIIPDPITAGAAFANGEKGWWQDKLYASTLDNNVWTPQQHPSGWQLVG